MNRMQGTAFGTLALAMLLMRGGGTGSVATGSAGSGRTESGGRESGRRQAAELRGPWMASCEYWAPARVMGAKNAASGSESDAHACEGSGNRWGIPEDEQAMQITTLVATVPDPVHSDFAPEFDRAMDALIDAGEDNGYLTSYYWLPWEKDIQKLKGSLEGLTPDVSPDDQHEPGLIIFKSIPHNLQSRENAFQQPLYLFLVGETPTSGVDGEQMQKALHYQDELAGLKIPVVRSLKNKNELALIGPIFSGSASGLREIFDSYSADHGGILSVQARGITSTHWAADLLGDGARRQTDGKRTQGADIHYSSFGNDAAFDQNSFSELIDGTGISENRIAVLVEDDTTLGQVSLLALRERNSSPIVIRYPREISMLRNAETAQETKSRATESSANESGGAPPSPFLHFSLQDSNAYDSVPHLSSTITPLSQESQLMAIARELERCRAEYVIVTGTNVLDQLFLAQFLHRAVPDARLVFDGGDLLFEREVDDIPYIGSLTIGPYPLAQLSNTGGPGGDLRAFSDWATEAYYNAASATFFKPGSTLKMADYSNPFDRPDRAAAPPLWITVIGRDGYYPLGIANRKVSEDASILPTRTTQSRYPSFHPSRGWHFLCLFVFVLCAAHSLLMQVSDFWSPLTRDLAIDENDQPCRRSMCIHIAAAMLVSMAVVVGWPLIAARPLVQPDVQDWAACAGVLAAGAAAFLTTRSRTWAYLHVPNSNQPDSDTDFYNKFNAIALATLIAVPAIWIAVCSTDWFAKAGSHAGLYFAWRCLRPGSGVSPMIPLLLLLLSWYLWAVFQTLRLRFSKYNRPRLPRRIACATAYPLYVSDEDLECCESPRHSCLFRNMTCLLITREAVRRFFRARDIHRQLIARVGQRPRGGDPCRERLTYRRIDQYLTGFYFAAFAGVIFLPFTQSMDRVLWPAQLLPTPWEFLIKALFFPLLMIALTGWLRMILIWNALQRGLLQRLENLPIRFAFDRLKGAGWMAMFRESGLREQWRDMARSTESMRQFRNQTGLSDELRETLRGPAEKLEAEIEALLHCAAGQKSGLALEERSGGVGSTDDRNDAVARSAVDGLTGDAVDLPSRERRVDFALMYALENSYARFAEVLLEQLLLPWWSRERTGLVESEEATTEISSASGEEAGPAKREKAAGELSDAPQMIRAAEEFLAIRYVSLIRAVLVNLRYLMYFISAAFVLAIVAWNSYPFEPHRLVNWLFTVLLVALGVGVIWVFAQMHRDPILSRITHTRANELGLDFYIRVVTFGAVPVLTWIAYNYPAASEIFRLLKPGVDVMR